jgi:pyruvate dehydrogenase E2 component (dihydrolipoamide acetyltransferase)
MPEEYAGATFTLSNLGSFGIEEFTAIINPPGSAIMALGKMQKQPVVAENDELVVRTVMKVTLSCDHRVIDGALGAGFLASFKAMIENPMEALY